MPQFVAALLALISSFSHGGQPLTIHPQTSNITPLGSQVSDLAKTFHLQNSGNESENGSGNETENQTGNSEDNFGSFVSNLTHNLPKLDRDFGSLVSSSAQNQTQNETENQSENETENQNESGNQTSNNGANPDVTKVPADNIHSGFHMPTNIPQVALDHSDALEPPSSPSGTPFLLPPGHRK